MQKQSQWRTERFLLTGFGVLLNDLESKVCAGPEQACPACVCVMRSSLPCLSVTLASSYSAQANSGAGAVVTGFRDHLKSLFIPPVLMKGNCVRLESLTNFLLSLSLPPYLSLVFLFGFLR